MKAIHGIALTAWLIFSTDCMAENWRMKQEIQDLRNEEKLYGIVLRNERMVDENRFRIQMEIESIIDESNETIEESNLKGLLSD